MLSLAKTTTGIPKLRPGNGGLFIQSPLAEIQGVCLVAYDFVKRDVCRSRLLSPALGLVTGALYVAVPQVLKADRLDSYRRFLNLRLPTR